MEISLCPGLPQIYFLGLADKNIKESTYRIKSALKHQGFSFPRAKKVLVNLRPGNVKKSSLGLEFAVAMALLWKMGQPPPKEIKEAKKKKKHLFIYGELGLHGEVFAPEDLKTFLEAPPESLIFTGEGKQKYTFDCYRTRSLKKIGHSRWQKGEKPSSYQVERPSFGMDLRYSAQQAQQIAFIALGEHSSLFLGPTGSGKSTLAQAICSFLSPPSLETHKNHIAYEKSKSYPSQNINANKKIWRPLIYASPHSTPCSLLGGGNLPQKGDISRAHSGILILEDFLLFSSEAQEALRIPMEKNLIYLSRNGKRRILPAEVLVLATSSLCPCSKFHPNHPNLSCHYTLSRCRSYRNRLSPKSFGSFCPPYFYPFMAKGGQMYFRT